MKVIKLESQKRESAGKGSARQARREGRLPCVMYGEGAPATAIEVDLREFRLAVQKGARVIDLIDGGDTNRVLLKDVQYDALGRKLLHADFLHVHPDREITLAVPVRLRGVPRGVLKGGVLAAQRKAIEIRCLPGHLPEQFDLDVTDLGLGGALTASDVPLPENVTLSEEPDAVVATIVIPRGVGGDDEEAEEGEGAEGEATAEGDAGAEGGEESTEG